MLFILNCTKDEVLAVVSVFKVCCNAKIKWIKTSKRTFIIEVEATSNSAEWFERITSNRHISYAELENMAMKQLLRFKKS